MEVPMLPQRRGHQSLLESRGFEEFPPFLSDPFGVRDFRAAKLKGALPRILVAALFYYFCVFINNLSQAWLQIHMSGFYESTWGDSFSTAEQSVKWLKEHEPSVYDAIWPGRNVTAAVDEQQRMGKGAYESAMKDFYRNNTVTLFDLTFIYLPKVDSKKHYPDMFAGCSMLAVVIRYIVVAGPMTMRWTILTRVLLVWGALFLCRALSIIVTPLPNPYHQCVPVMPTTERSAFAYAYLAFGNLPGVGWITGITVRTCQDVMFSGHTVMGTTGTLFFTHYIGKSPWFGSAPSSSAYHNITNLLTLAWLIFGWYVIAATHFHYTVDVLIGALMSYLVFTLYHQKMKVSRVLAGKAGQGRIMWPSRTIAWFEQDSEDLNLWEYRTRKMMMELTAEEILHHHDYC